jgi:hypothetical protein
LEHLRETRFTAPKITLCGTASWPAAYKISPFRATGVPKIIEYAPEHESSKNHPMAWEGNRVQSARTLEREPL